MIRVCLGVLVMGVAGGAGAQTVAAPNYAKTASWVCRPGAEDVCTTGLDTLVTAADGSETTVRFVPAANPAIDCFYVYPTVSREQSEYADMTLSTEIARATKAQVGRLSSRCRVFAPIYRQATLYHLQQQMSGSKATESDVPMEDVRAAWAYYITHDNNGRGVVLIGHSQGTILLQRLIAEQIDGKPAQHRLVSAILAGDPSLGVPAGKTIGGTFQHIPVCGAAGQTGCVYAWGTYLAGEDATVQVFGHKRRDGLVSACVNPAAPGGGIGALKVFTPRPSTVPATNPPWVETLGALMGVCRVEEGGNGFRVSAVPGPLAEFYTGMLRRGSERAGWGLHVLDLSLVQGNVLDVLDAEIANWGQ